MLVAENNPNQAKPTTTASEAPMLIPSTPGSASGLRVTPCMTAPERPSAAPTTTARTVRGIRLVTAASPTVSCDPPRAATISDQPTSREPTATEATISATRTATTTASHSTRTDPGRRTRAAPGVGTESTCVTV
jgi:hypothetical protein